MEQLDLSKIMLGAATAATQIEGGEQNNSWCDFARQGKIKDGSSPVRACDHINRYKEDIALMKELNLSVYRLGLEWSRIEPSEGSYSIEGIEFYKTLLAELNEAGIKPLVTLHHFTNPTWFQQQGGWTSKRAPEHFLRFVRFCIGHLREHCNEYVTINEPNVYATMSYFYGEWPPQKKSLSKVLKVFRNMARAHILAYEHIHSVIDDALVGIAQHLRVFEPLKDNLKDKKGARLLRFLFNDLVTDAMAYGRARFPLAPLGVKRGVYFDFLGINYYSRYLCSWLTPLTKQGAPLNDLGWEIYPDGLRQLCHEYGKRYPVPIFITENGTCDNSDSFRSKFILDHLGALCAAVEEGADVQRYYHWTLMDNFEWLEGESARFGLVHTNFETGERTIKESGRLYAELAKGAKR